VFTTRGVKYPRAYTEINLTGRGGGQNLNCKFKTFGFLDTFKGTHTNYLANTTLSLLQTKLAKKQ